LPHVVPISNVVDPRVAAYAGVRDRDLAGRDGVFVVESENVVRVLLARSRYRVRSLLLEERRVGKLAGALAALDDDVPVYVMAQGSMDALVGFPIHRGVLAIADRGEPLAPSALVRPEGPRLLVGLLGLSNHDNVGGIFRSAAAFAVDGMLIDPTTCDPLYRKAVRVSVGGALVVPFARCASEAGLIDELFEAGYEVLALTPRGEVEVAELARASRAGASRRALLVGAEGPGLSDAVLARTQRVRIAMGGAMDSLNVSVACAIALHALRAG
jgi:tRNA G18 (ribose-2'-O)-methylase SpoU